MKFNCFHLIVLFSIILIPRISTAQLSCCANPKAVNGMKIFVHDPVFLSAHESPLPFNYVDAAGKMISFSTSDGKNASAYEIKTSIPTTNYLFVFHEWWGLNDYIKLRTDDLQKSIGNVNVIAIDMYDGKIATVADSAGAYMSAVKDARLESIINGAITYAGKTARIATIGWCFGGGLSLKGTSLAGKQAVGCVMYYGMPITEVNKLKELNCDVLGIFASKEKWISPQVVAQFEKDMKSAGKNLTVKNYDAEHAFANPSNPHYDKVAAADANANALEFLKKVFI